MQYITDLRADDVLLGRGSGPNDHEGNIRFRQLVADRKNEYMATNHRLTKANIAQEIVAKVYENNGRFLRKLENEELALCGIPDGVDAWAIATDDTIMEKAKQALRQNSNRPKGDNDPTKPKAGSPNKSVSPKPPSNLPISLVVPGRPPALEVAALEDFEPIPLSSAYPDALGNVPAPVPVSSLLRAEAALSLNADVPTISVRRIDAAVASVPAPHDHTVTPPPPDALQQQTMMRTGGQSWGRRSPPPMMAHNPLAATAGGGTGGDLDAQDDSILSHLPPHLRAQFLHNPGTNNDSMSHIPHEEFGPAVPADNDPYLESRRGSMTMTDLARYHRRRDRYQASEDNMSVVMDSFSKMRTTNDGDVQQQQHQQQQHQRKMYASSDTMGTIEPIGMGSMADMSFATMNSSTFSVFRGNESTFGNSLIGPDPFDKPVPVPSGSAVVEPDTHVYGRPEGEGPIAARAPHAPPQPSPAPPAGGGRFETSFSHTDLPPSRTARYHARDHPPHQHVIHEGSESTIDDVAAAATALGQVKHHQHPRPIRLMEDQPDEFNMGSMGLSSMEILKSAFQSSTDWDIPVDDPSLQAPAQSLPPPGEAPNHHGAQGPS